ncbi:MAG TPA: fatty acid desaturase [Bryobacteraceae bacterium]|nr:fatty acid desaturase [Bryobacteraceae bacterium]
MSATSVLTAPQRTAISRLLEGSHTPDNRLALLLFWCDLLWYALCLGAALLAPWPVQLLAGVSSGLVALRLAAIAHDAGHQSFTSSRRCNRFIGRIAFLPSLQPLATWEVAHNVIHHSWTSIRHKDYVWIPFSPSEYAALPAGRRLLERIYRSAPGQGLYYLVELWWKRVVLPSANWNQVRRPAQRFDIVLVASVALLWTGAAAVLATHLGRNIGWTLFCAAALPFLSACQCLGWLLYVQHTHPRTRFYSDRTEWEFFEAQSANSTHIKFPPFLDRMLNGVLDHTAHHLDVRAPFYRLRGVQAQLDCLLNGRNVAVRWSWQEFLHTTRVCKLFDYERGCWTGFDGLQAVSSDRRRCS